MSIRQLCSKKALFSRECCRLSLAILCYLSATLDEPACLLPTGFSTSIKRPSFEARNLVSQKGLLVAPDNAFTPCVNGGLGAVAEVQFAEDIADVTLNRLWTDKERLSNIIV